MFVAVDTRRWVARNELHDLVVRMAAENAGRG